MLCCRYLIGFRDRAGSRKLEERRSIDMRDIFLNLEVLDLKYSLMKGEELLLLVPDCVSPVLNTLTLVHVEGLSEDDMFALLTRVAPTIRTLFLEDCLFSHPNGDLPFYFLDRVMPLCIALKDVQVVNCSNVLTAASLHRKPTLVPHSRIFSSENLKYDDILGSLVGSKWSRINVRTDTPEPYTEADRISAEQGIGVYLWS
jgi:hypothetical protein